MFTKGESSYTYEQDRILPSKHDEGIYSHRAEIVLNNSNHELDDKNLKGYDAVISYGFSKEYSPTSPLAVIDQQFDSDPNKLTCTLELEGIPNLMAEDEASEVCKPDEDDTKTVKTLVNAIVGATLAPFTHCHAFEVVWNTGYDPLANTYKPKDSLRIYSGNSRLAILRRVLDYTANVPRFGADGKIHIMKPVTSGDTFDSEYSLQEGQHQFFSKAYRETLVFPNRIVVRSQPDDDPQYSGEDQVDGYDSLPAKVKKTKYVQIRLGSDNQAASIAEALIAKAEMGSSRGQAEIRINVGAEVFDYDKVTDQRQGDTRAGNLGYVHRRFGKDKWTMTFGFGNWFDALRYQKMLKELETYTDAGQYFSRLSVGDLYAENLLAKNMGFYWIDPDNTIDLSKIGDTLDNLPDGEQYLRVSSWNLSLDEDPESPTYGLFILKMDEHVTYQPGYNPTTKFDLDQDTLDKIADGETFHRVRGYSLSAAGLVLLDQVEVGDTYDLVLKTDISQGHILLSKTEKDGLWYDESGVAIDATKGIAIYGGVGLSGLRTYPTLADYEADNNVQCYIGTDGKIYAGGGDVQLDADGLLIDCTDITTRLKFKYIGKEAFVYLANNYLCIKSDSMAGLLWGAYGVNKFVFDEYDSLSPISGQELTIGRAAYPWYGGYFSDRLKIPVGTDCYD